MERINVSNCNLKCCKCGKPLTDNEGNTLENFYEINTYYNTIDRNTNKLILRLAFCEDCNEYVAIKYVPDSKRLSWRK